MLWPNGSRFAFTVVDDTEGGTVANLRPIYDLLSDLGIKTTKTVWVYPPRDAFTGSCLQDDEYRAYILELQERGFEIALHGVGSGAFTREEIVAGLELYRELLGNYPKVHINHAKNPDNVFWGQHRFSPALSALLSRHYGGGPAFSGHNPDSPHFWGDILKERITYVRNHTFRGILTSAYDPFGPYRIASKEAYSNYWFSSSDGHNVTDFGSLTRPANLDALAQKGGYCIVYTHFAEGFVRGGKLDRTVEENLRYLASLGGWYVPVSQLLDHVRSTRTADHYLTGAQQYALDLAWLRDRLHKDAVWTYRRVRRRLARRLHAPQLVRE